MPGKHDPLRRCYVKWKDDRGEWHETARYATLAAALGAVREQADRSGLKMLVTMGSVDMPERQGKEPA